MLLSDAFPKKKAMIKEFKTRLSIETVEQLAVLLNTDEKQIYYCRGVGKMTINLLKSFCAKHSPQIDIDPMDNVIKAVQNISLYWAEQTCNLSFEDKRKVKDILNLLM